ncbi:AAA domain-containing protein [Arsenicicoccus bolidensis]|uniref:AAA domain-containing protein n=1 Tax=Arsenicicoccus bolidensis TaxID=229480 RepID=A0ABS9Q179_9MICO|nr:AAA domain-containing protein [Arsenicicoccus bolidensis]MCG7321616.1 AAA domain-containing protein [Arsenicicoccus bolidensis]
MTSAPPAATPPTDVPDPVAAAVARWRRELIEAGGPNSLLWRPADQRGRLELTHAHPAGLAIFLSGRDAKLSDLHREPRALAEAVVAARRLRATAEDLWEQRGLATCFLAAGMATWQTSGGAGRVPSAPVFLRPCELRPRDLAQTDFDLVVSRTVELNPALVELVRAELGVELDGRGLAESSWGRNGFDPESAYRELLRRCSGLPGFTIERRLGVALLPYAKLGMVADLAGTTVAEHPVVRALAGDPAALRPPTGEPAAGVSLPLVLPVDEHQRAALDAIGAGDDVVVQGAPGTGMTQVVAAAVAGLAGQGRSVLLVSHARSAITAVQERLAQAGLDLVVEAHDGPDLRHEHGPLTAATPAEPVQATAATTRDHHAVTERLQGHLVALHQARHPWGVSAFQAQGAMVELSQVDPPPRSRVRLAGDDLAHLTPQRLDVATRELVQVAEDGAWLTHQGADPWRAARITTPAEADAALAACERLDGDRGLTRLTSLVDALCREVGLPRASSVRGLGQDLDLVSGVRATLDAFVPEVFDAPLPEMLAATSTAYRTEHDAGVGPWRRQGLRRDARRLVRPGPGPTDLHDALATAHDQVTRWRDRAGAASRPAVPHGIDEARAAHHAVVADLDLLEPVLATTADGAGMLDRPVEDVLARVRELLRGRRRLAVLPLVTTTLDGLRAQGLGPLVEDLAARRVPAAQVASEVRHVWWSSVLDEVRRTDPHYGAHDGSALDADAAGLRRLDALALRERAAAVATAVGDARPCWATSPHEIASLLPVGVAVDTVIVLEASQLSAAQAVSALSRGRQVVVCGDQHQLPPGDVSVTVPDPARRDDDVQADQRATSVLSSLAEILPVHTLATVHHGVDDRVALAVDRRLHGQDPVVVPVASTAPRVQLELVDQDRMPQPPRGEAPVTTAAEVDRVVRLVVAHARSTPERSLGVVTFHPAHADAITAGLREQLASLDLTDASRRFFAGSAREPLWIKPVDQVQGRTRDDVIVSVGYALDEAGQAGHRFGALALGAGERRAALAVTRARQRLVLVSSVTAEQLRQVGAGSAGVELLAEVLQLAGTPAGPVPSLGGLSDPVTRELAARLRQAGLTVTERAGRGAGAVELAVRDPRAVRGVALAVESDGVDYARGGGPVDRDVRRPELLSRAGWEPLRVWTADVFTAPERVVARIVDAAHGRWDDGSKARDARAKARDAGSDEARR